jgi:hypothetical protein
LPQRLAIARISYNTKTSQRMYESNPRTAPFRFSTGDLTKLNCTTFTQGPHAPDYFIDVDSVTEGQSGHRDGRTRFTQYAITPGGFSGEICAQSQIRHMNKYNGYIEVTASWREYRNQDVVSSYENLPPGTLTWQQPLQLTLPPEANAITVALDYFDGSHAAFVGNDSDKYSDMKWNSGTKQILISAKRPDDIDGIN